MSVLSAVPLPLASPRSPSRRQAEDAFLAAHPSFRETGLVDVLRETEYTQLDASGQVYLAYTGGSLYAESQLEDHTDLAFPLEETYCSRMLRGEISRVIPDTGAEPGVQDLAATSEIGAYIGMPITLADGRVHGTLCCASHNPRPELGSDELKFMQVLADIVARLVERSQRELLARTARL